MKRTVLLVAAALASGALLSAQAPKPPAAKPPAAKPAAAKPAAAPVTKTPVFRIETAKGPIVVETYPMEAPKSCEHILALVKKNFYNNQAVHRVVPGQAVQFGDPQSRNMMLSDTWGRGPNSGSGQTIGVNEVSKTRKFRRGSLAIAN